MYGSSDSATLATTPWHVVIYGYKLKKRVGLTDNDHDFSPDSVHGPFFSIERKLASTPWQRKCIIELTYGSSYILGENRKSEIRPHLKLHLAVLRLGEVPPPHVRFPQRAQHL